MTTEQHSNPTPVALVTGASRGLGLALVGALARRGWRLVIDARDPVRLAAAVETLPAVGEVTALAGDISDRAHRQSLAVAVRHVGRLDLLVNNASSLGPSPLVPLADHPLDVLEQVYAVNTLAPLGLTQLLLPQLERSAGRVLNITSDASTQAYRGWGGYGSSKAALDQLTAVLAVEHPTLRIYAFDPGDMATELHQAAYPGEDISDRPDPDAVVPALLGLIDGDLPSGRYRVTDLRPEPALR